jgi:hypothetical protein
MGAESLKVIKKESLRVQIKSDETSGSILPEKLEVPLANRIRPNFEPKKKLAVTTNNLNFLPLKEIKNFEGNNSKFTLPPPKSFGRNPRN